MIGLDVAELAEVSVPVIPWEGRRVGAVGLGRPGRRDMVMVVWIDGSKDVLPANTVDQVVDCILWFERRGIHPEAARALVRHALGIGGDG